MNDVNDRLDALYSKLPAIACKGKCWNSCGVIDMSRAEHRRIVDLGYLIPQFTTERAQRWANDEPLHCPALNRDTLKCDVYRARPMICRLWGLADPEQSEQMACPHGCKPTRALSLKEIYEFLFESMEIGGHETTPMDHQTFLAILDDEEAGPLMARFLDGDKSVGPAIHEAVQRKRL